MGEKAELREFAIKAGGIFWGDKELNDYCRASQIPIDEILAGADIEILSPRQSPTTQ